MGRLRVRHTQSGQTVFELVVVLAIVGLLITGIVSVVTLSVRNSSFSRDQSASSRYSQEALEWVRQERDKSWSTFQSKSGQTYCMKQLSWSSASTCGSSDTIADTPFLRTVTLENQDANSVLVEVVVSWQDSQGSHQSRLSTVLTDWNK